MVVHIFTTRYFLIWRWCTVDKRASLYLKYFKWEKYKWINVGFVACLYEIKVLQLQISIKIKIKNCGDALKWSYYLIYYYLNFWPFVFGTSLFTLYAVWIKCTHEKICMVSISILFCFTQLKLVFWYWMVAFPLRPEFAQLRRKLLWCNIL